MKRFLTLTVTLIVLLTLLCFSASAAETVEIQITGRADYAMAESVFAKLNEHRVANGLAPLVLDSGLTGAAMQRAAETSVYFAHTRPDGSSFSTVISQVYGRSGNCAENIASGQTSASSVMTSWKGSTGHNENMLRANMTHVGIGCVYVNGGYYWVQLFSTVGQDSTNDYSGTTDQAFVIKTNCLKDKLTLSQSSKTLNLSCHPSGESGSTLFAVTAKYNATDSDLYAYPLPTLLSASQTSYTVQDDQGTAIATISIATNGESPMNITPLATGSATIELPLYSGQTDPFLLTLVITEEHIHSYIPTVYAPTCVDHGWTFYQCGGCGHYYASDRTEATGIHEYGDWQYQQEPTLYSAGQRYKGCIHCSEVIFEVVPALTNPFVDVNTSEFYGQPVAWAVFHEITNGIDDTHFGPHIDCTRGQIVTFLWRAFGKPEPASTENPFTDVHPGDYYYEAVLWAVGEGITKGISETQFAPEESCTRAQAVTFLYRTCDEPDVTDVWCFFVDIDPDAFYYNAVLWAVDEKITTGTDSIHFSPDENCSRAQIVTFLYRAIAEK